MIGELTSRNTKAMCVSSKMMDYVFYASVVVLFVITRSLDISPMISSWFGVYFYLIVPYIVGESICGFLECGLLRHLGTASKYYLEWVFGVILFTVLFAVSQVFELNLLLRNLYNLVFVSIALNILIYSTGRKVVFHITINGETKYLLFSLSMSVAVVAIVKLFFLPIPNIGFNFDIPYTTYRASALLLYQGYFSLVWRWVEITIPGVICPLLNLDPLYFIAMAPFSLMIFFTAGTYLLSYTIFKKPAIALIAVLLGIFVNLGSLPVSMFIDNPAYVYRSNTILASIFPLSLLLIVKVKEHGRSDRAQLLSLFLVLVSTTSLLYIFFNVSWIDVGKLGLPVGFLGYYVFPIASSSLFVTACLLAFLFKEKKTILVSSVLVILVLTSFLTHSAEALLFGAFLSFFCLSYVLPIQLKKFLTFLMIYSTFLFITLQARGVITRPLGLLTLNRPLPSFYLQTGFDQKWDLFFDTSHPYNTYVLFLLLTVSVVFVLVEKRGHHSTILSSMWAALLFFFLPELFSYRNYHILTPLMAIAFAYVIDELGIRIDSFLSRRQTRRSVPKLKNGRVKCTFHGLTVVLLLILISPVLFVPFYSRFSFFPEGATSNSYFAQYDYQISNWIKGNTPKNTIILSDYFSMKLYQGLSLRPLLFTALNSGEESSEAQAALWFIKTRIFQANASDDAYSAILSFVGSLDKAEWLPWSEKNTLAYLNISLDHAPVLVVINPRTCRWVEQQGIDDVRPPYDNVTSACLRTFNDRVYFELVYRIDDKVYVFRPTNLLRWYAADYPGAVGKSYDESLIAYWSFDELNGTIAYDYSGNGNNGILVNGPTRVTGHSGSALSFNGIDDYVEVDGLKNPGSSSEISVEAWINPFDNNYREIVGQKGRFLLRIDPTREGDTISFFVWINGNPEPRARGIIINSTSTNRWYHVVGTYDGRQVKIYVNGLLAGISNRSGLLDNSLSPVTIGIVYGNPFKGIIDEVRIYNRALSEQEVQQHYVGKYGSLVRNADVLRDVPGVMVDIPFKVDHKLVGEVIVRAKVALNNDSAIAFVIILQSTTGEVIYYRAVWNNEFKAPYTYESLNLGTIVIPQAANYNFRIIFTGSTTVWVDTLSLLIRNDTDRV